MHNLLTLILVVLVMGSAVSQTQSVTIEASQNITNFRFSDSNGNIDKNYAPVYSGGYALGYKYEMEQGVYFLGKLGMRKSGATYVFDNYNYAWDLQYAELRLGIGYKYGFGKFGAHFVSQPYLGFLVRADQRLNNQDYDLLELGEMNDMDYGVFLSPGINFTASELIGLYLDLNYMFGLANLETNDTQQSQNRLIGASLGVSFTIK